MALKKKLNTYIDCCPFSCLLLEIKPTTILNSVPDVCYVGSPSLLCSGFSFQVGYWLLITYCMPYHKPWKSWLVNTVNPISCYQTEDVYCIGCQNNLVPKYFHVITLYVILLACFLLKRISRQEAWNFHNATYILCFEEGFHRNSVPHFPSLRVFSLFQMCGDMMLTVLRFSFSHTHFASHDVAYL